MEIFKPTPKESAMIAHQFMSVLFYHQILDDNRKKINSPFSSYYTYWGIVPSDLNSLDADFCLKDLARFLNALAVAPVTTNFRPSHRVIDFLRNDSIRFGTLHHIAKAFEIFDFSTSNAIAKMRELEYTATSRKRISLICNHIIPSFYRNKPEAHLLVLDMQDVHYQRLWEEICNSYSKYAKIAERTNFGFNYDFNDT